MKLAITGPGGFIARHVAIAARLAGHELLLWQGRGRASGNGREGHLELDFESPAARWHLEGVDALIHLAGRYPRFGEDALSAAELMRCNVEPTAAVLESCAAAGVPRFVLASSAAVYRQSRSGPLPETAAVDARGAYADSKLRAEALVRASTDAGRLHGVSLRLFNVYGPGQPDCNVFSAIAVQALADGPVRVHDERPVRDFIHVADAARALVAAATGASTADATINIGSGRGTSVRELGALIMRAAGRSDLLQAIARGDAAGDAVVANIARARRALRWQPVIGLPQGVADTLATLRASNIARAS